MPDIRRSFTLDPSLRGQTAERSQSHRSPPPRGLTRQLVERRLVAGSHQIESVRSIYRWQGKVHDVREARVTLRTRLAVFGTIAETVAAGHPYVNPSIVAIPIVASTGEYRQWVLDETG
jgi:periplasmic divalent cation tolerance protein